MKLKSINVFFNTYDFENGGIPAKSYGGSAEFDLQGSTLHVKLTHEMVQGIVNYIAPTVLETCENVAHVSMKQINASLHNNILAHEEI